MVLLWLVAASSLTGQILTTVAGGGPYPSGPALQRPVPEPYDLACGGGACYVSTIAGVLKVDGAGNISSVFGLEEAVRFSVFFNSSSISSTSAGPAITLDPSGNLYVLRDSKILKVAANGSVSLVVDLTQETQIMSPAKIAADSMGNLYITDRFRWRIFKVTSIGAISVFAGTGGGPGFSGDGGPAISAMLGRLSDVKLDDAGNLYFVDDSRVRKVTRSGIISTVVSAGEGTDLYGLTIDSRGNIYYYADGLIRRVSENRDVVTVAGGGSRLEDGIPATSASVSAVSLSNDAAGNLYFADSRWRLRKVDSAGVITTVAGNGSSYWGEGAPATSSFVNPQNVVADSDGTVYFNDGNYFIRKVSPDGTLVTIAGDGTANSSGDGGPARASQVRLRYPSASALDSGGSYFFRESDDFSNLSIRTINRDGIIRTTVPQACCTALAISPTGDVYFVDNRDVLNKFKRSTGALESLGFSIYDKSQRTLGFDANGNLYFIGNPPGPGRSSQVWRLTPEGVISLVAGSGVYGPPSGDGGQATLAGVYPLAVTIGADQSIYLIDDYNSAIRKIDKSGIIQTITGSSPIGQLRFTPDGASATTAAFVGAFDLAVDGVGNLYVWEQWRIRKITFHTILRTLSTTQTQAGTPLTLDINGTGFIPQSIARWNGSPRPTTYVNPILLRVQISAADTATPGAAAVTVATPEIAVSNALTVTITPNPPGAPAAPSPADNAQNVSAPILTWSSSRATSYDVYFGAVASPPLAATVTQASYTPGALPPATTYFWRIVSKNASGSTAGVVWRFTTPAITPPPSSGLRFVPLVPCRVADTRAGAGTTGAFGPPSMAASSTREFPIPAGRCGIPTTAAAYSLNVTAVPQEPLAYVTLWPTGRAQPLVSTLNSFHGGVVANAALAPAGDNGAISVFTTGRTDLILDINGYFDATGQSFYAVNPCRVVDTRSGSQPTAGSTRDYTIAGRCGVPQAAAFSLNVTAVPANPLSFLTLWPAGQPQPLVSTLNSFDKSVVANAALAPAGAGGAVSVFVTDNSDVILDVSGYFAAPGGVGELRFHPVTPCRVADTRAGNAAPMGDGASRDFPVAGTCGVPGDAKAYSLNVTAVPTGPLAYLTLWPTGAARPLVSTLNSFTGRVVANAAFAPAGADGQVSVFVTNSSQVILDINGYFR